MRFRLRFYFDFEDYFANALNREQARQYKHLFIFHDAYINLRFIYDAAMMIFQGLHTPSPH